MLDSQIPPAAEFVGKEAMHALSDILMENVEWV